ncbi:hypothetical protein FHG87_004485 [Trinorchestia longiramus]|nr:hypothetical protein FHG87_004485 [Trinorchestia longiramus]
MKNRKDRNFSCYDSPYATNTSPRYECDDVTVDDHPASSSGGPLAVPATSTAPDERSSSSPYSVRRSCETDAMNGHCSSPTDEAMEVESDDMEDSPMQSLDYVNNHINTIAHKERDPNIIADKNDTDPLTENILETSHMKNEDPSSKEPTCKNNPENVNLCILSQLNNASCTNMSLQSSSSVKSSSPSKVKVGFSCGSTELPSKGFLNSSMVPCVSGVTPHGTPQRHLLLLSPPASATNSLTRRSNKRRADDTARRSWGSTAEREEGPSEFWASIQEPYDYIMTSALLPPHSTASTDSLNKQQNLTSSRTSLSTTTAAALAPFVSNPFPVFMPLRSPSKSASLSGLAPPSGHLELTWDPDDIMASLADYHQWTTRDFLLEYRNLYVWMIQLQLKWYAAAPPDAARRRTQHEELQRYSYLREMFTEQGARLLAESQRSASTVQDTCPHKQESSPEGLTPVPQSSGDLLLSASENLSCRLQDQKSPCDGKSGGDALQASFTSALSTTAVLDGMSNPLVDPAVLKHKLRCLENKWQQLETSVAPPSAAGDKHVPCVFHLDLELEEEVLVSWLDEMEVAVPALTFCTPPAHSTSVLTERLHHNQVRVCGLVVAPAPQPGQSLWFGCCACTTTRSEFVVWLLRLHHNQVRVCGLVVAPTPQPGQQDLSLASCSRHLH